MPRNAAYDAPLPAPLIAAATRLLHLTEGTPR